MKTPVGKLRIGLICAVVTGVVVTVVTFAQPQGRPEDSPQPIRLLLGCGPKVEAVREWDEAKLRDVLEKQMKYDAKLYRLQFWKGKDSNGNYIKPNTTGDLADLHCIDETSGAGAKMYTLETSGVHSTQQINFYSTNALTEFVNRMATK